MRWAIRGIILVPSERQGGSHKQHLGSYMRQDSQKYHPRNRLRKVSGELLLKRTQNNDFMSVFPRIVLSAFFNEIPNRIEKYP